MAFAKELRFGLGIHRRCGSTLDVRSWCCGRARASADMGVPSVGLTRQVEGWEIHRKIVRGAAIEMDETVERAKRKPSSSSQTPGRQ
jgi:hypothetical protein